MRTAILHDFHVVAASAIDYQVEDLEGQKWAVSLQEGETACDCNQSYEYQAPCKHIIIAMLKAGRDPLLLFSGYQTTEVYRSFYKEPLYPLSIQDLEADPSIKPPKYIKQKGRPRTKRFYRGQYKAKKRKCGNCGLMVHHNSRSRRSQPAVEGSATVIPPVRRATLRTARSRQQRDEIEELRAAWRDQENELAAMHEAMA